MTANIIFYILFAISAYIFSFWVRGFILGKHAKLKARPLNEIEKSMISAKEIMHATTANGMDGITKEQLIHPSKHAKAYSNQMHPCVYFSPIESDISKKFNRNKKYSSAIYISNLTEEQINHFKIRDYDSSLIYPSEFALLPCNKTRWEPYQTAHATWKEQLMYLFSDDYYAKAYRHANLGQFLFVLIAILIDALFLYVSILS